MKEYEKYITPRDFDKLLESIDEELNEELIYRIRSGKFSKENDTKSTGIFYVDKKNRKIAGKVFVYNDMEVLADLETTLEYRRKGIGTNLIKDAVEIGAKYLAVSYENINAFSLYKKCGFIEYYYDEDEGMHYMSTTGKPHIEDEYLLK